MHLHKNDWLTASNYSKKHLDFMKSLESTKAREYPEIENRLNSIYLCTDTYSAALMSAGSLLNVVDSVVTDKV